MISRWCEKALLSVHRLKMKLKSGLLCFLKVVRIERALGTNLGILGMGGSQQNFYGELDEIGEERKKYL